MTKESCSQCNRVLKSGEKVGRTPPKDIWGDLRFTIIFGEVAVFTMWVISAKKRVLGYVSMCAMYRLVDSNMLRKSDT